MSKYAILKLREDTHYRSDAFSAGLKACGYTIAQHGQYGIGPNTTLVLWNRKAGHEDKLATTYEALGARVVIAENGYIGKDANGHQLYALALGGHNGSGKWHVGKADRWSALGIESKPWQVNPKGHLLLCGQRGIGSPSMASPMGWHLKIADRLRLSGHPVVVRNHPGDRVPPVPIESQLAGAYACVIWSSGSGVKALVAGCPVLYAAPHWSCAWAARKLAGNPPDVSKVLMSDDHRAAALHRLAYAQWSLAELTSGEAFDTLLNRESNS